MAITDLEIGAYRLMAETGLSAREISELDMQEYARLSKRPTPVEAALTALGYTDEPGTPAPAPAPQQASVGRPQPVQEQAQGLDPDSPEYFAAWRQERLARSTSGEGHGIFDSVGSRSDAYTAAVRQQAGRTSLSNQNVQEPPRIGRVFIQQTQVAGRQSLYQGQ